MMEEKPPGQESLLISQGAEAVSTEFHSNKNFYP